MLAKIWFVFVLAFAAVFLPGQHAFASAMIGKVDYLQVSDSVVEFKISSQNPAHAGLCALPGSYVVKLSSKLGKEAAAYILEAKKNNLFVSIQGSGSCTIKKDFEDLTKFVVASYIPGEPANISSRETAQSGIVSINNPQTPSVTLVCASVAGNGNYLCQSGNTCTCPAGSHSISTVSSGCLVNTGSASCQANSCYSSSGFGSFGQCCVCIQ